MSEGNKEPLQPDAIISPDGKQISPAREGKVGPQRTIANEYDKNATPIEKQDPNNKGQNSDLHESDVPPPPMPRGDVDVQG